MAKNSEISNQEELAEAFQSASFSEIPEVLSKIVLSQSYIKQITAQMDEGATYCRFPVLDSPYEVSILAWAKHACSAIHLHKGFYGYVQCLYGVLHDIRYQLHSGVMQKKEEYRVHPPAFVKEPEGIIHEFRNQSDSIAISLHVYEPPIRSFEGLTIFELESGQQATLTKHAIRACFQQSDIAYENKQEQAFKFLPYESSHERIVILPKPEFNAIIQEITDYYAEQANEYDNFDLAHQSRIQYINGVNRQVVSGFQLLEQVNSVLAVACGTGRRAIDIQTLFGKQYSITGVEVNHEMGKEAIDRGVSIIPQSIAEPLPNHLHEQYDAAHFLYAYGHIVTRENRKNALIHIYDALKPGGILVFDAFNIDDQKEWGPHAKQAYKRLGLMEWGYEQGDVFYRKKGGKHCAFLHYASEEGLKDLILEAGFQILNLSYIGYVWKSGQIVTNNQEGFLCFILQKPK